MLSTLAQWEFFQPWEFVLTSAEGNVFDIRVRRLASELGIVSCSCNFQHTVEAKLGPCELEISQRPIVNSMLNE